VPFFFSLVLFFFLGKKEVFSTQQMFEDLPEGIFFFVFWGPIVCAQQRANPGPCFGSNPKISFHVDKTIFYFFIFLFFISKFLNFFSILKLHIFFIIYYNIVI